MRRWLFHQRIISSGGLVKVVQAMIARQNYQTKTKQNKAKQNKTKQNKTTPPPPPKKKDTGVSGYSQSCVPILNYYEASENTSGS